MTICVAALAAKSQSIVCIADKSLAYGDYIVWDSDGSKMIRLNPSGAIVMFAGGERDISEVLSRMIADQRNGPVNKPWIRKWLKEIWRASTDEQIETLILRPNLLTMDQYIAAISGSSINPFIRSLADRVNNFSLDCALLICGFDGEEPYIFSVGSEGVIDMTTTGFHAIGSGSDKAVARLLFVEHAREHDVERVIFDCFDAKANAEMTATVGYEWDA